MTREKSKKQLLYILYAVIVLILVIIAIFYFASNPGQKQNSNNNTSATPTATISTTPSPSNGASPSNTPTTTITMTPTPSNGASPSNTPIPSTVPTLAETASVKVMYSVGVNPNDPNDPNSETSFAYVEYRFLKTKRGDTENFVLEKTIEGPTQADFNNFQLYTPIKLIGDSNCDGKDFTLTKDTTTNTITVQFCKQVDSAGVGTDARVQAVIRGGMQQFLSDEMTKKVIILDKNGNCFGDQSGLNKCKG